MATTTAEERAAAANMRSCSNGIASSVDSNLFAPVEIEVCLSLSLLRLYTNENTCTIRRSSVLIGNEIHRKFIAVISANASFLCGQALPGTQKIFNYA
jgi:hypothetical protein